MDAIIHLFHILKHSLQNLFESKQMVVNENIVPSLAVAHFQRHSYI